MRLFHATDTANVPSILAEGLKPHFGEVYLSDSIEGAARWKLILKETVSVVEVEVPKKLVKPGTDHSPLMQTMFKCGPSFVIKGGVAPWKIKAIHDVTRVAQTEEKK